MEEKETTMDVELIRRRSLSEKLTEVNELAELLGYSDQRSVEKWCKQNKVPLLYIGKKVYTLSDFVDRYIGEHLERFVKNTFNNSEEILRAIYEDDKAELSKLMSAPLDKKMESHYKAKANSKAADDFLTKLNAA